MNDIISKLGMKFGSRTFAGPHSAIILTLVNDAAKMGLSTDLMVFAVKATLIWAAIETVRDVVRMVCEAFGKKAAAQPQDTRSLR